MRHIFKIDIALIPTAMVLIVSGFSLHISGHGNDISGHHIWEVTHIASSILFLVLAGCHIKRHWPWYRNLFRPFRKSKWVTATLSVAFLFEAVTGIMLLTHHIGGELCANLHWVIGELLTIFVICHIASRIKVLKNAFRHH